MRRGVVVFGGERVRRRSVRSEGSLPVRVDLLTLDGGEDNVGPVPEAVRSQGIKPLAPECDAADGEDRHPSHESQDEDAEDDLGDTMEGAAQGHDRQEAEEQKDEASALPSGKTWQAPAR